MLEVLSLIENCGDGSCYHTEHGLSLFIRQGDARYLLDTGASDKFLENAEKMGVDLTDLDGVIISHNHFDHIGGLPALLARNPTVKVFLKNAARSGFYFKLALLKKYIGEEPGLFERYADRFVFFEDEWEISKTFRLLSNTALDEAYSCKDRHLYEMVDGRLVPDRFRHELFAVLEEPAGLVIVSSCSHNGIVNIVNTVKRAYPGKPVLHVIGGFHMVGFGTAPLNCTPRFVEEVADTLAQSCENTVYTCHCTGKAAFDLMRARVGEKIAYLATGERVTVG